MKLVDFNLLVDSACEISKKLTLTTDPDEYKRLKCKLMALVILIRDARIDIEEVEPPKEM